KALYTLQTGYALGRDLGDAPLLISTLVGIAICTQMCVQVEAFIQAPESPNLYWALTTLHSPLISLRKPLQGEKMLYHIEIPELRNIESKRFSAPELRTLTDHVTRLLALMRDEPTWSEDNWQDKLELTALVARLYPEAKRALTARGRSAEEVEALPALQVVL